MRLLIFCLILMLLLIAPAITQASYNQRATLAWRQIDAVANTSKVMAENCAAQANMLSTLGRPSPQATLLATQASHVSSSLQASPNRGQVGANVYIVQPGDTLGSIAAQFNTTVHAIAQANGILNPNRIGVGQKLLIPEGRVEVPVAVSAPRKRGAEASPILDVWLDNQVTQGEAALIWVRVTRGTTLYGQQGEQGVPFHSYCNLLWGLVAFDVLNHNPGTQYLTLRATEFDGRRTSSQVGIPLRAGNYWRGPQVTFPHYKQHLLEPDLIRGENEYLNGIFADLPDAPARWSGPFQPPRNSVMTSPFGAIGLQDGVPVGYHEGIDYRGGIGSPFYAPEAGRVVVAERLMVRGGTVYLDHGAGVVTGYFHQNELLVKVGDWVNKGELLGWVGAEGLTTGPHLHWEVRVNGRWVNPMPWLERSFP